MIPQTLVSGVAFLFLVAPGMTFELLRERRRPALRESGFREISRTALASLVFSVAAVTALAGVRQYAPDLLPDPGEWLREGSAYVPAHYPAITRFFLLEFVLAGSLAIVADRVLARRRRPTIEHGSGWYHVFRRQLPRGTQPFIRVRAADGTEYYGHLATYTTDDHLSDRELVLALPLFLRRPGAATVDPVAEPWQRLVIAGPTIQELWVTYRRDGQGQPPAEAAAAPVTAADSATTGAPAPQPAQPPVPDGDRPTAGAAMP